MKNKLLIILLIVLTGCSISNVEKNSISTNEIIVVKFMYLDDYSKAISTKSFWKYPKEHAKFILPLGKNTFLDEIQSTLPKNDCNTFGNHNYAFVVKRNEQKNDTIYADISLKTWMFKKNGKVECHYDENGSFAEFLRQNYPFFKDCW